MRESSQAFFNPSGTASGLLGPAALLGTVGAAGTGVLSGQPSMALYAPLVMGGAVGSANLAARLMTNRGFVRWLASGTNLKPNGMGAHLGRLSAVAANSSIEDRQAIREYLDFFNMPEPAPQEEPEPEPPADSQPTVIEVNG